MTGVTTINIQMGPNLENAMIFSGGSFPSVTTIRARGSHVENGFGDWLSPDSGQCLISPCSESGG
jgi:hypothetical protein